MAKKSAQDTIQQISKVLQKSIDFSGIQKTFDFPGLRKKNDPRPPRELGSAPGIDSHPDVNTPPAVGTIKIECIDYSVENIEEKSYDDVDQFLQSEVPSWAHTRWINIDGLHPYVIKKIKESYHLHALAAEDVLNIPQRPKVENYENNVFVVARMLLMREQRLDNEQVSIFYSGNTLITIQEKPGDVWDNVRKRLHKPESRLRTLGNAYLLYALLDSIVDHTFPLLEKYGDILSDMEVAILKDPSNDLQQRIHEIKRELLLLRRVMWPMREAINSLYSDEDDLFPEKVKPFFRDVYDHSIQAIDIIESYREMASGLHDLYMSVISNRMNEVMKVLTIMASVFIPVTFLAGVYGMNFEHIPELSWQYSYPTFWILCILITGGLLFFFRKNKWI